MEKKTKRLDGIEKTLASAYRDQDALELPPEWREGVMRRIRRLHVQGREAGPRAPAALLLQRVTLSAATASGLVALALLAYMLAASPGMEQDLFAALTQDPSGLIATHVLGM